ncbi:hypothetical protein BsWGS_21296 [Bradybaena similaris]
MEVVGHFISTVEELDEVLAITDKPVLLYFYSEFSHACRRNRFHFMQAMSRNTDAEYIAANIDNCRGLSTKLQISPEDIPALVVFKDGKIYMTVKRITDTSFNALDYVEAEPPPVYVNQGDQEDESVTSAANRKNNSHGSMLKDTHRK